MMLADYDKIVEDDELSLKSPDTISKVNTYDIVVCGGTLGIFYGMSMLKVKSRGLGPLILGIYISLCARLSFLILL